MNDFDDRLIYLAASVLIGYVWFKFGSQDERCDMDTELKAALDGFKTAVSAPVPEGNKVGAGAFSYAWLVKKFTEAVPLAIACWDTKSITPEAIAWFVKSVAELLGKSEGDARIVLANSFKA